MTRLPPQLIPGLFATIAVLVLEGLLALNLRLRRLPAKHVLHGLPGACLGVALVGLGIVWVSPRPPHVDSGFGVLAGAAAFYALTFFALNLPAEPSSAAERPPGLGKAMFGGGWLDGIGVVLVSITVSAFVIWQVWALLFRWDQYVIWLRRF